MSIYTYNSAKKFCGILNIEFQENNAISDQELDKILQEAYKNSSPGGTDYVSGLIWITNGKQNAYIDPKKEIPSGWRKGRTIKHMAMINPEKWKNISKESAKKQWFDNTNRKKSHSNKMKQMWNADYDRLAALARKNGKHGLKGKLHPRALLLEYKGVEYYGWRELKEATGVTKDLYKKYYLNGIDPEPRIGKDGPISSTSTVGKAHQGGSA